MLISTSFTLQKSIDEWANDHTLHAEKITVHKGDIRVFKSKFSGSNEAVIVKKSQKIKRIFGYNAVLRANSKKI